MAYADFTVPPSDISASRSAIPFWEAEDMNEIDAGSGSELIDAIVT